MNNIGRLSKALLILCFPVLAVAQTGPQPFSIDGAITHVYKSINGTELRLHVFNPPNHSSVMRRPAILFFFGGFWARGDVEQFVPQSKHFAERGMVAIVADYRVSGRHGTTPFDAMSDARSAIRWVRSRAEELGVDAARIAASGGSSGGHIALSAAVLESNNEPNENRNVSSKPNALVLFNPAVDTSTYPPFGARRIEGSPFHNVGRDLPPTAIFHGKADTTVPYGDVERFCTKAKELGGRCELFGYDGAEHGFFNPRNEGGKWYRETLSGADQFLTAIGYLTARATTRVTP